MTKHETLAAFLSCCHCCFAVRLCRLKKRAVSEPFRAFLSKKTLRFNSKMLSTSWWKLNLGVGGFKSKRFEWFNWERLQGSLWDLFEVLVRPLCIKKNFPPTIISVYTMCCLYIYKSIRIWGDSRPDFDSCALPWPRSSENKDFSF